ncbi:conserved hypothetical protein [Talaromyces stipitatus ATCC 10500]|uniref:DUF7820 domain-containing protein n=1 Tax=Talaromyces stipitatus (strain ATCC 10500 / CBS 375.48 / QM 6759 / NRRL 1006) TaxID=441959 RepID=B8M7N5_TALSN|nr:uncharacterized protein TSTA_028700 [Talaromyces stipitatus ATCC 10500]EED19588.1 conserved hypothetical protein [Talaromyces stipitatus ATCC 10500]
MVRHNDAPWDSVDSSRPQMSDLVPADGSLFRPSHAHQPSNPNVFSDDYSIDSIDAPLFSNHQRAQSFSSFDSTSTIEPRHYEAPRPVAENSTRANLLNQQSNRPPLVSNHQRDESLTLGRTTSGQSQASSVSHEGINPDPFADQPTSSFADSPRPSSIRKTITSLNRQSTVSTTSTRSGYTPVPRAMSPYRGATGPSHPYGMYPQVGVGRSPSVATVSTIRQFDSPLRGQNAPQHPYAMYPQNIDYEEDLGDQPIPVGFPPRGIQPQATTTRADDVGDIIGPDGHLEQLPPYSRYPDGVIRPTTGRGPASIASDMRGRFERYQDEPHNRPDASSGTLVNADSSEPLRSPSTPTERSSTLVAPASLDEKLSQKGRQRCCGAPVWLVVMVSMAMIICALLGGAIGGVLGEKAATHRAQAAASARASHSTSVVTVTYTSDVSPYTATPTGFAALPTGNYQVPWVVTNVSKFCVGTSGQMQSWSCQIMNPLAIDIQGSVMSSSITIEQPNIKNGHFSYGAQLPYDISPPKQHLSIMIDKEDPQLGPALFFQSLFNKLVIVQDSPEMQAKRSLSERDTSSNGYGQGQTQDTTYAKPWFCWWNETQIEIFIYLNQTQDGTGSHMTSAAAQPTTGSSTTSTTGSHKRDLYERDSIAGVYPRKFKVKENRINPSAPQAYCQQMQFNSDNSLTPIVGRRFNVNETAPTGSHDGTRPPPCYCEWMT